MKQKHLLQVILMFSQIISAQEYFDFEEDKLIAWIQWPDSCWICSDNNPINGSFSLHHEYDNEVSGTDIIAYKMRYPELSDTLGLEFSIRHAYNPSSGNNWQLFFLASDTSILSEGGFFASAFIMGVNYKCSDDLIKLWQILDGELFEVCASSLNYQSDIGTSAIPRFKLKRSPDGIWKLLYAPDISGLMTQIASGPEKCSISGEYFGFSYSYSSAQDRKLWVDDILVEGSFYDDTIAVMVDSVCITGLNTLDIYFNEEIQPGSGFAFSWKSMAPKSVRPDANVAHLEFELDFPNRITQHLYIQGVSDRDGNIMADTAVSFMADIAEYGDIVITEVFADPTPSVYLPEYEYLEIFNRSGRDRLLEDWTLILNGKEYQIHRYLLYDGAFLLLCSEEGRTAFDQVPALALFNSASSLPNKGARIKLYDNFHRLIHMVNYPEASCFDHTRSEGGWALECIDPGNVCGGTENWGLSEAWKGGSPGEINSIDAINEDLQAPALKFTGLNEAGMLSLNFSEPLMILPQEHLELSWCGAQIYPLTNETPIVSDLLTFEVPLETEQEKDYNVEILDLKDCAGNAIEDTILTIRKAEHPLSGSVVLNEILFDPWEGANEYIEILNCAMGFIDLRDLKLMHSDDSQQSIFLSLSDSSHLLAPGAYAVITKSENLLRQSWDLAWNIDVLELAGWRTLPNGGACIYLADRSEKLLDSFCYSDSLHHDMLASGTGVALERVHPDSDTWISAASSANYGSPGQVNSQYTTVPADIDLVSLEPAIISPDMDGYHDIMNICPEGTFTTYEIFITDMHGNRLRTLVPAGIAGTSDTWVWDGHDDSGHILLPGIYIVHILGETYSGTVNCKKACALSYR